MIKDIKFKETLKKIKDYNFSRLLPGYKFNNLIFKIGIGLIFIWLLIAGVDHGWDWVDKPYFKCSETSAPCENPWYTSGSPDFIGFTIPCLNPVPGRLPDYSLCSKQFFMPGESYGRPPGFFMRNAGSFAWIIVVFMILLNHFLYNKGYGKKLKKIVRESDGRLIEDDKKQ
jgi:hypothetical protein